MNTNEEMTEENFLEYFEVFDDTAINYISENCDSLTDEELRDIINKEKSKNKLK